MSSYRKKHRDTIYFSVTVVYVILVFLIYFKSGFILEAHDAFGTLTLAVLLFFVTFDYSITSHETLDFEKEKSNIEKEKLDIEREKLDLERKKCDIELKQKQLELFYYPFLQSIKECQNSSEKTKKGIDQLFKYQYLTLDSNIKEAFRNYADINHKETSDEFEELIHKVRTEIDRIESGLNYLYKNEVKILDKGSEAVKEVQGSKEEEGNGNL